MSQFRWMQKKWSPPMYGIKRIDDDEDHDNRQTLYKIKIKKHDNEMRERNQLNEVCEQKAESSLLDSQVTLSSKVK